MSSTTTVSNGWFPGADNVSPVGNVVMAADALEKIDDAQSAVMDRLHPI
jgi:hypothetical protein